MWPVAVSLLIVVLFAAQYTVGYGQMCSRRAWPTCRTIHRTLAVAIGVMFVVHDALPLLWLKKPMFMFQAAVVMPVGLLVYALLGFEYLVGFRVVDFHRRFRAVHFTIAWTILALGMIHGAGIVAGYGHEMAGDCTECHRPPPNHPSISCPACHRHPGIGW